MPSKQVNAKDGKNWQRSTNISVYLEKDFWLNTNRDSVFFVNLSISNLGESAIYIAKVIQLSETDGKMKKAICGGFLLQSNEVVNIEIEPNINKRFKFGAELLLEWSSKDYTEQPTFEFNISSLSKEADVHRLN